MILIVLMLPCFQAAASAPLPRLNPYRSPDGIAPITVTNVEVEQKAGQTRFLLTANGPLPHRLFTLADPYRVVIDMPEVPFVLDNARKIKRRGLAKAVRYGLFRPANARAVIDLTGPAMIAKVTHSTGESGAQHLLTVDLVPTKRSTFMKTAGWPGNLGPFSAAAEQMETVAVLTKILRPVPDPRTRRPVVVLDAGHGGIDPGTSTASGVEEKDVTLSFAKALKLVLERKYGFNVKLTRDRDVFIRLRERVKLARAAQADLFISIHADSLRQKSVSGAAVYTLSEQASDGEAAELARLENRSDIIAGVDLHDEQDEVASILIDLAQRETNNTSISLARRVVRELKGNSPVLPTAVRQAGFRVLKAPDVPSVLIELGFLSNQADAKRLTSAQEQKKLSELIARGISAWLKSRRGTEQ